MCTLYKLFGLARRGELPPEFDMWELHDEHGVTLAHATARNGKLPPDFDQWGIMDGEDWTVAHEAALRGFLPPDFDRWDLKDVAEWSVRDIYDLWKNNADKMKRE